MLMMNVRNTLIGLVVSALLVGIVVSCGGGGGGGYGGGGGGGGGGYGMAGYTVGGTLSIPTGTAVLKFNGGSDMTVANGPFTFATTVAYSGTYNVQVVDANHRCTVANGAGTMGTANVTNVVVTCAAQGTQKVIRSARLDGAQAGTMATGTGFGGVIVDPTTMAITGGVTFAVLSGAPTGAHIHRGNATIAVGLTLASDNATGIVLDNIMLSPADYAELLAGTLYFNVHTAANPGGEIRGQINVQGGVLASLANLDGTQEVNSTGTTVSTSTATGKGTVIVDAATRTILISYIMHNVGVNATLAHIHSSPTGPAGTGPVIVGFTLQPNIGGTGTDVAYPPALSKMTETVDHLPDFLANYLYFNVHSSNTLCNNPSPPPTLIACGSGEIRGNITPQ
jgi:hypothetical protein